MDISKLKIRSQVYNIKDAHSREYVDEILVDKDYSTSDYSGLGRVYLKKNMSGGKNVLTQDMINKANTRYIIQYDYDLNVQTITISENCVLEFEGGSISNGTLNGDNFNIVSNRKCLTNVKFSGKFAVNTPVKVTWFIDRFPKSTDDTSVDNTTDIQFIMTCGAHNVKFPLDKFIHLTKTINVNKGINIITDNSTRRIVDTFSATKNLVSPYEQPCIFSKSIVTLFNYIIEPFDANGLTFPFNIGNITLYVDKAYTNTNEKDTPILSIKHKNSLNTLWGVVLDCNIRSRRYECTINGQTDIFLNYTGIKFDYSEGDITYVKINGDIFGTNYGIVAVGNSTHWMTDVEIKGNTWCCQGGVFDNVGPIIIYGSHQTHTVDFEQPANKGYFEGKYISLNGYVWDCGHPSSRSSFKTVETPIYLRGDTKKEISHIIPGTEQVLSKNDAYYRMYGDFIIQDSDSIRKDYFGTSNVLDRVLNPTNPNNFIINPDSFIYSVDGTNIINTNPSYLYNRDNLFNSDSNGFYQNTKIMYSNAAYIIDSSNTFKKLNIDFVIDTNLLAVRAEKDIGSEFILGFAHYNVSDNITINISTGSTGTGEGTILTTYNGKGFYYFRNLLIFRIKDFNRYVKIKIDITLSARNLVLLPTILIPSNLEFAQNYTSTLKPNILAGERHGFNQFDAANNRPIWWNGTSWVGSDGLPVEKLKGATNQRPTLEAANSSYQYYDTSFKKPTYFDGSKWLDANGFTVARNSGTTDQRPNLTGIDVGFQYYDSSLGKPIWWNGEDWIDATGESV